MNILIIADKEAMTPLSENLLAEARELLEEKGNDVEVIETGPGDVAPCLGCLRCLTKTHGVCVNVDVLSHVNKRIGDFDLLCYFGPIVFGQFSATMKNVLDRTQIHKMMRSRFLIAIGYGEDVRDDELATFLDTFKKHRGKANSLHPQVRERFEVFASRSIEDNNVVCAHLKRSL
ncbi:MAG: NAD(P)H-dependent oxidoreductase [Spirochaetia bacterium]|jgi:multimeric flavodoxin WrbA